MDHIANNVLTALIEKNTIFIIIFSSHNLAFVLCFSSTPVSLGIFQLSSTCPIHLMSYPILVLGRLKKNENNFQHYNIISAYRVKDETSTSRTYVSRAFYHMVRSRKILVKKELQVLFSEGGSFEWFCTKIPLGL
jgi:hypothetical protein